MLHVTETKQVLTVLLTQLLGLAWPDKMEYWYSYVLTFIEAQGGFHGEHKRYISLIYRVHA